MSVTLLFLLLFAVLVYWLMTQILPERRKNSLLRPGLGEGLVESLNERRHELGLPLLEMDEDLMVVAENKAVHQIMTGRADEGWEYPEGYDALFGQSLIMEALFSGPVATMVDRMARSRDVLDGEWIRCGIGVAGGQSGQMVVALILCREAWEPQPDPAHHRPLFGHHTRW
jgi:hypothetical protein